nr:uncharacterized protein CI109_000950 [Kwoniella shandongensis]KAA5530770.1 hypothetical protein CI109_000950 [Kwoniella shandongensis]
MPGSFPSFPQDNPDPEIHLTTTPELAEPADIHPQSEPDKDHQTPSSHYVEYVHHPPVQNAVEDKRVTFGQQPVYQDNQPPSPHDEPPPQYVQQQQPPPQQQKQQPATVNVQPQPYFPHDISVHSPAQYQDPWAHQNPPYDRNPQSHFGQAQDPSYGPPHLPNSPLGYGYGSSLGPHPPPYQGSPHRYRGDSFPHDQHQHHSVRKHKEKPQVQVIKQEQESESSSSSMADTMQMMMMSSMMMQQMQAQQMQAAQMAAMTQQTMQMQLNSNSNNQNGNQNQNQNQNLEKKSTRRRKPKGSINIKSVQKKPRGRKSLPKVVQAAPQPLVVQPPQVVAAAPPPIVINPPPGLEMLAMDNWQEATIILCFAAVGLIYLICSRGGGGNDKKKDESMARKHMS